MYNVLYIQKMHHDLFLSGPILHRKCSVRNKMFGFALALNLNPHSGSCSVVLLNLTPNIMFGSGSNIVRNVRNRTVASLLQAIIRKPDQFCSRPVFRRTLQTLWEGQSRYFPLQIPRIQQMFYCGKFGHSSDRCWEKDKGQSGSSGQGKRKNGKGDCDNGRS